MALMVQWPEVCSSHFGRQQGNPEQILDAADPATNEHIFGRDATPRAVFDECGANYISNKFGGLELKLRGVAEATAGVRSTVAVEGAGDCNASELHLWARLVGPATFSAQVTPALGHCSWAISFTLPSAGAYRLEVVPTWYSKGGVWRTDGILADGNGCSGEKQGVRYEGVATQKKLQAWPEGDRGGGAGKDYIYASGGTRWNGPCDWCSISGADFWSMGTAAADDGNELPQYTFYSNSWAVFESVAREVPALGFASGSCADSPRERYLGGYSRYWLRQQASVLGSVGGTNSSIGSRTAVLVSHPSAVGLTPLPPLRHGRAARFTAPPQPLRSSGEGYLQGQVARRRLPLRHHLRSLSLSLPPRLRLRLSRQRAAVLLSRRRGNGRKVGVSQGRRRGKRRRRRRSWRVRGRGRVRRVGVGGGACGAGRRCVLGGGLPVRRRLQSIARRPALLAQRPSSVG
jgi:hypothetical protein